MGKDFVLYTVTGGVSKPVVCATEITITVEQEIKEATKPTASRWRSVYAGGIFYNLSASGVMVIDGDATTGADLLNKLRAGESIQWLAHGGGSEIYGGTVVPGSVILRAPAEGPLNFTLTAQGDGELTVT